MMLNPNLLKAEKMNFLTFLNYIYINMINLNIIYLAMNFIIILILRRKLRRLI